MEYLDINLRTGLAGLAGALAYFLLLMFPMAPGGLPVLTVLLTLISVLTCLTVLHLAEDRIDLSNIVMVPLAGVAGLGVFITVSEVTVSVPRILGIFLGPGFLGIALGALVFRIFNRYDFDLELDVNIDE